MTSMLPTLLGLALFLAPPAPSNAKSAPPSIPDTVFVEAKDKPKDAKTVAAAKKGAKKGDTVVIDAKIGGRAEPFVRNRAVVMVADRSLKSCDRIPGDTCSKPWDYCCEPPESKKANMMTIQFVGADGKPLKCGAQGVHGLEPLALVTFEGTVAEIDDKGTFVVSVKRIHVEKPKAADEKGGGDPVKAAPAAEGGTGAGDGKPAAPGNA